MPQPTYMWLKDHAGTEVKGSVTIPGREGSVEIWQFDHKVHAPTDDHTGNITGTRKHDAITIIKPFDASSIYLYRGVCNGENFTDIEFKWYQIEETGNEVEYFNHTLKDCQITSVRPIQFNIKDPTKDRYVHLEEVQIRYKEITWKFIPDNAETTDSWSSRE